MKFVQVKNFNSTEVFWYTRMTTVSLFWYTNFGHRGITWTGSTCIPWKGSHCLVWTFVNPVFATKHGNSIVKGCKLLFGLVARETWLRLLRHVYNFSCYGLLSVPYNFSLWQKKVLWGIHVSETKQTVFLFAPLIFGSFYFQVSPSICGVHQDWGSRSASILLWSFGEPNCT